MTIDARAGESACGHGNHFERCKQLRIELDLVFHSVSEVTFPWLNLNIVDILDLCVSKVPIYMSKRRIVCSIHQQIKETLVAYHFQKCLEFTIQSWCVYLHRSYPSSRKRKLN